MPIDPLAGTELERVALPEGVYGFGWAELRYLLGQHDTPAARTSARSLGFDAAPVGDVALAAGLSSLLVRGLAAPVDDRAVSRGEAAVVETVLARGLRWSGISLRTGDTADLLVLIEDGEALAVFQPRSLGTWFVGLTNERDDPSAPVLRSLVAAFEIHGPVPFAIETRTQDAVVGARFFRPQGEGWSVADSPDGEARRISRKALADEIAGLLQPLSSR